MRAALGCLVLLLAACASASTDYRVVDYTGTWVQVANATPDVLAVGVVEPETERVRPYVDGLLPNGWAYVEVVPSDIRAGGRVQIAVMSQEVRMWVALSPVRIMDPGGRRNRIVVSRTTGTPRGQTRGTR